MSYVVLTIDTTKPELEIFAPRYTTHDVTNTITIEANEPIADYQDIYVVDSQNVRHDYTFFKESDNQYVGKVRFNDFPLGVATIYARLKDEVNNFSDTVVKNLEIKESLNKGNISISDKEFMKVETTDREMINVEALDYKKYEVKISDKEHGNLSDR
jgi:hypothetical protein